MRTIIRALPLVVGAFILGAQGSAAVSATPAHQHAMSTQAVLVILAAIAASAVLTWLTRGKGQQRRRSRRSRQPAAPWEYWAPMRTVLAAAAQHGHLPVHVTPKEGMWIVIVLIVVVFAALARGLRT